MGKACQVLAGYGPPRYRGSGAKGRLDEERGARPEHLLLHRRELSPLARLRSRLSISSSERGHRVPSVNFLEQRASGLARSAGTPPAWSGDVGTKPAHRKSGTSQLAKRNYKGYVPSVHEFSRILRIFPHTHKKSRLAVMGYFSTMFGNRGWVVSGIYYSR
jgi:hypothetical protein